MFSMMALVASSVTWGLTTGSWRGCCADIHRRQGAGGPWGADIHRRQGAGRASLQTFTDNGAGAGVLFRRSQSTGAGRGAPACVGPQGASSLVPGGGSTWWSGSALEASVAGEAPSLLQEFQEVQ